MSNLFTLFRHHVAIVLLTLSLTIIFLLHAAGFFQLRFIQKIENFLYDTRILLTMPEGVDPSIVVVDIDEKSLDEIGRWPWGRNRLAKLVDELFDYYQVSIVGFDVIFREPDRSSGMSVLTELGKSELADIPEYTSRLDDLRSRLDYDQFFIDSLKKGPVILGYTFFSSSERAGLIRDGYLPAPVIRKKNVQGRYIFAPKATGYGANLAAIQQAAAAGGHITPTLDEDGVVRRVPMLIEFDGDYYESFSLALARNVLATEKVTPVFGEPVLEGDTVYPDMEALRLDHHVIPVDANVQALVPYRGKQKSFPYVSAVDIIKGRADINTLQGAIVLVGTSAKGLVDLRPTPVSEEFPGVEIHANLIAGILDQTIKQKPAYMTGVNILQLFLGGVLMSLLMPLLSPVLATLCTVLTLGLILLVNFAFWQYANLVVPLASILILVVLVFILNMSYGFFIERRSKRKLSGLFGQYLPPELVDEMSVDPEAYTQAAQNREMTVLFSDVRGFTTLSEGLSPGELSELMNAYLTPMTKIIHENRGTIDKYIGDAIMAFWGAPLADPEHARDALITGLAMLERLNATRDEFLERGWPELHIGVGINTGIMSVGDMGSEFRMAYTVLGDAVNLGSRLEGLTKSYGVEIIVSGSTRAAVPDFVYRELDVVRVKGKDKPISIYEPLAPATEISNMEFKEIVLHEQALKNYRKQDWDTAELQFRQLQELSPGRKLYPLYLERIEEFRIGPPGPDWDGVYTHTSK
ncbi:MAG: CHASE2 domain-containing protein [Gammaproteobacteria bacterium]